MRAEDAFALLRAAPKIAGPWEPIPGNDRGVQRVGTHGQVLAFAAAAAEAQTTRDRYDRLLAEEGWDLL